MNVAILRLMHKRGHLSEERKGVERPPRELDEAGVELADLAELGDDGDQPRARLRRLIDHLPLAIAQRIAAGLQHPEIAADDAGRRTEFVNRKGNELRVTLFRRVHVWNHLRDG